MTNRSFLTTVIAMAGLLFAAIAPPALGAESQSRRDRLKSLHRDAPRTGRTLTAPTLATRSSMQMLPVATPSTASAVSGKAHADARLRVARASVSGLNLRGTVLECASWTGDTKPYGLYSIPSAEGEEFSIIGPTSVPVTEGWDDGNGSYYSTYIVADYYGYAESCHLVKYNTADWSLVYDELLPDYSMYAFGSAEDPTTGEVYACCSNATFNGYDWVKIDYANKSVTVVKKELPIYYMAVGCDSNGQFYGLTEFGRFVKIDKNTGEYTEYPSDTVLPASVKFSSQSGACVDDTGNRFLVATYGPYTADAALHAFDISTGAYSKVIDFPASQQVLGLYIPAATPEAQAPAQPALAVTCEAGAMEAVITLSAPATLQDGSDATGQTFGYTVSTPAGTIKEGEIAAGATITERVPLTVSGLTVFTAQLSNDRGVSRKARATCYIGKGTPAMPQNVVLTISGTTASLSWDAVTSTTDGGYIDPAGVTYTVYDAAGNVVKENLTSTSTTIEVSAPESGVSKVAYAVAAVYADKMSGLSQSNAQLLGAYAVPVSIAFDSEEAMAEHTVLDANDDDNSWYYSYGSASIRYSMTMAMDDWLISPPVALEAGKTYPFKARVRCADSYYPERIEVKAGKGTSVADMTISVISPTDVTETAYTGAELQGNIVTDEAGNYHVGFHGISDAGMYNLYVISYQIDKALSGNKPVAVADLEVTPGADGALTASVSYTAPATNIDGGQLTSDVEMVLTRGEGTEVDRRTVAPGTAVTVSDVLPEPGEYTYSITAAAGDDISEAATATAYVGPVPAAMVAKVLAYQTSNENVRLSWDPVTADINGAPIAAADVTYEVYGVNVDPYYGTLSLGDKITGSPIAATTYDVAMTPAEKQDFSYFAVKSLNRGVGHTDLAVGNTVFGDLYTTPYRFSSEEDISSDFLEGWSSNSYTSILIGSDDNGVSAQDGDNSYIMVKAEFDQSSAYFATGNIDLTGADSPEVTVWIYGFDIEGGDPNNTTISVICEGQETPLSVIAHKDLTPNKWNRVSTPLQQYAGKNVRLKFLTEANGTRYSLYDNIYVGSRITYDLAASLAAPLQVKSGVEFDLNVTVRNDGAADVPQYAINLLRDGQVVETRQAQTLAVGESAVEVFRQTLTVHDAAQAVYAAEAVFADDEATDNNLSADANVKRIVNKGPVVTGLTGHATPDGDVLTWDPVETNVAAPETVSDSFEDCTSWAHEIDDWTFIDGDESPVGGISGIAIPGISVGSTKASFFVWDYTEVPEDTRYTPHTGNKCLVSLFRKDNRDSDEWAISPRLDGNAQTISFFAKSFSGSYPERIEMLCTSGATSDLQAYAQVKKVEEVPTEWTEYTFEVPAGTTHFAIRSTSPGAFMLMLDDFSYTADRGFYANLLYYKVYCNRELVSGEPVPDTAYRHIAADGENVYHVTALYDNGESEPSAPLTLISSGIDTLGAGALSIRLTGRTLVVTGAGDARVLLSGADGRMLHSGAGDCRLTLAPGAYLLKVGNTVRKLMVR